MSGHFSVNSSSANFLNAQQYEHENEDTHENTFLEVLEHIMSSEDGFVASINPNLLKEMTWNTFEDKFDKLYSFNMSLDDTSSAIFSLD